MSKHSAVRLAVALAALASPAMAVDFERSVSGFAGDARRLASLQISCALGSGSAGTSFKKSSNASAPDFTLNDLSGTAVRLSSLRGKVVLLDFWATWCPPCRASSPFMQELQDRYGAAGLEVLGVNLGEDLETVKKYTASKNLTYRTVLDLTSSTEAPYEIAGIPTFVLIGTDGKILWRNTGFDPTSKEEFKVAIEKALAAPSTAKRD